MRRILLAATFVLPFLIGHSQLKDGYVKEEVRDMIAICNSYTFLDLYGTDAGIIPEGYAKSYTSRTVGLDNKFQVYKGNGHAVMNFRGSTAKAISWMENIYSAMIPAQGEIIIDDSPVYYKFAEDTAAAVHAGYALGIAYLSEAILWQIHNLNKEGYYDIIIAGHSQGGALAHMARAYLENLPTGAIDPSNSFKTYAFANPMVGNEVFKLEYNERFTRMNTSYSIHNSEDPIPGLPISYRNKGFLTAEEVSGILFEGESVDFKQVLFGMVLNKFEGSLTNYLHRTSNRLQGQITKSIGHVGMPEYKADVNYSHVGYVMHLSPFSYPLILRDSTILQNDSLMAIYGRGPDGHFYNKSLYKKSPAFYQHKPYNYFVEVLRSYFPAQYEALDRKYLAENL